MTTSVDTLNRALERERKRRAHAEQLLEEKSRELFHSYESLEKAHEELKENQKKLVQSEKMASLGILSAGIAHEVNTPIGFVLSNVTTLGEYTPQFSRLYEELKNLLEKLPDDDRQRISRFLEEEEIDFIVEDTGDLVSESLEGVTRVRDIVAGLKTFSHADNDSIEPVDINDVINSTLTLARSEIERAGQLSTDLQDVPALMGNRGKLGQVIMNLVVNASQAICEEKGEILVRSRCVDDEVVIDIQDNGCGMDEETQMKLFTPFFTTKEVGEGTGLGLTITFGIVEEHRGRIEVSSALGEGTTFSVHLPLG